MTADWQTVDPSHDGVVAALDHEGELPADSNDLRSQLPDSSYTLRVLVGPAAEPEGFGGVIFAREGYRAEDCPTPPFPSSLDEDYWSSRPHCSNLQLYVYEATKSVAAPESRVSGVLRRRKYSGCLPARLASNRRLVSKAQYVTSIVFHDCREQLRWEIQEEGAGRTVMRGPS